MFINIVCFLIFVFVVIIVSISLAHANSSIVLVFIVVVSRQRDHNDSNRTTLGHMQDRVDECVRGSLGRRHQHNSQHSHGSRRHSSSEYKQQQSELEQHTRHRQYPCCEYDRHGSRSPTSNLIVIVKHKFEWWCLFVCSIVVVINAPVSK